MATAFPKITHINQVLPAIEGRKEFKHGMNSPHFDMLAYYIQASDTFASGDADVDALRRECRGFLFHKDGTIARRAFHKFFNLGEVGETMPDKLDIKTPHIVLEKLDGSMVAPFISQLDGQVYWASMRGSWDYHQRLTSLFAGTDYEALVRAADKEGLTVIMEFCAPDNRIVIEYDAPNMTVLAIRHRESGAYLPRSDVESWGQKMNVPVVKPYEVKYESLDELTAHIRSIEGMEGVVLCFEEDNQDDLIGILSARRKAELLSYQDALFKGLGVTVEACQKIAQTIMSDNISRKDFAQSNLAPSSLLKSVIFKNFDGLSQADFLKDLIEAGLKNTTGFAKWDGFKTQVSLSLTWNPEIE